MTRWINEILVKVDWDQPYYSSYLFILTIHNYFICLDRSKNYKTTFDLVSQTRLADSVFDDSQVCLISFLISSISFYDFRFPTQLREAGGSMSVNLSGFASSLEAGICRQFFPERKPSCVRVKKVPSVLQRLKTKSKLWWVSSVEKIPLQLKFLKATYLKNLLKIPLLLNLIPF